MFKKNFILLILFQTLFIFNTYAKIDIKVVVDDQIITNIDIKKEAEYLKILNPNLNQLDQNRILELSKTSLINEIIKKKEILKFIDINSKENKFSEKYFENLYLKLNYNNEEDFRNELDSKNTYSIREVKDKINIELFWNEIIYEKYNKLVKINKNQ